MKKIKDMIQHAVMKGDIEGEIRELESNIKTHLKIVDEKKARVALLKKMLEAHRETHDHVDRPEDFIAAQQPQAPTLVN